MIKRVLAILLLGVSSVFAQTIQTTPNLLTSGTNHTWYGVTTGSVPANYMPAGSTSAPRYDPSTNTVYFSYGNASIGQTYAVNQALASVGAGVKVNGYTYSYDVRNMNGDDRQGSIDTFTVSQLLRGPQNSVLLSSNQTHNTKFEWKTVTGTRTATTPYNIADTTYIQFGVQGADSGFWAGYFGPQIRNVDMRLNYSIDPCVTNPAYSPTCANYNTVSTQSLFSGATGPQTYAINQALAGSGVMVHGFNYGYNYSVGGRFCNWMDFLGGCLGTWIYPSASMTTTVTDNADATIFTETNTHAAGAVGTYTKALRFGSSRSISTVGSFSMTPSTAHGAQITNMYGSVVYTADPCVADPLSSTSCPGYASAYQTQQCTINALYNSACPGYAVAYFNQQCNNNALYDQQCPGYAAAYLVQQCSINPLYSTTCSGYATAYHDQQCSINPLYATTCMGYQQAYHDQQCSANSLYATDCVGYQRAYHDQQCSISALYASDCPGYQQAYFTQQCTANPLYNSQCDGYKTAYAIKYITTPTPTTTVVVAAAATETVEAVKVAADPVAAATAAPSTTSATSMSPVAVISTVKPAPATETVAQAEPKKEEKKDEGGKSSSNTSNNSGDNSKPSNQPKSNREALAERRREAAQKEAIAKGKDLANEMGQAASLEAQKAVQNVVIQAMGFTPGFDQYGKTMIPDTQFYRPFTIYGGQSNIDTRSGARLFGGSDRVHQEMVDTQYQLGK